MCKHEAWHDSPPTLGECHKGVGDVKIFLLNNIFKATFCQINSIAVEQVICVTVTSIITKVTLNVFLRRI